MKLKDYLMSQQEYDEYCEEFEQWCDEQTAHWGFEPDDCRWDKEMSQQQMAAEYPGIDKLKLNSESLHLLSIQSLDHL
jgi:hypothetical protein